MFGIFCFEISQVVGRWQSTVWPKTALVFSITAVIFGLIGLAVPYWICGSDFHYGLYFYCVKYRNGNRCFNLGADSAYEEAAKDMLILGVLLGLGSVIAQILHLCVEEFRKPVRILGCFFSFMAAYFICLGATGFTNKGTQVDPDSSVGSSFYMSFMGGILFLATAVGLVLDTYKR